MLTIYSQRNACAQHLFGASCSAGSELYLIEDDVFLPLQAAAEQAQLQKALIKQAYAALPQAITELAPFTDYKKLGVKLVRGLLSFLLRVSRAY